MPRAAISPNRNIDFEIGPWPGGLNEVEGPSEIRDDELIECLNFDVHDDGVLRCRRVFTHVVDTNNWLDPNGAIVANQPILAYIVQAFELSDRTRLVYFASSAAATTKILYTADGTNPVEVNSAVPAGQAYASAVVYNGIVYFIPTPYSGNGLGVNLGFSFPTTDLNNPNPTITQRTLPRGDASFIIKDRLFVIDYAQSRVYYSKATDFLTWASPDGGTFDVNPKDNSTIQGAVVLRDTLYIFKEGSIYQFTFTADPGTDGYLQKLTEEMGGVPAVLDNDIYFVNTQGCYALVNGTPSLLSEKIEWNRLSPVSGNVVQVRTRDFGIIAIPGRLIIRRNGGVDGYSLNTRTGAWSRYSWSPDNTPRNYMLGGRYTEWGRTVNGAITWFSCDFFNNRIWSFRNDYLGLYDGTPGTAANKRVYVPWYKVQTKVYSFGERTQWKRFKNGWIDAWLEQVSDGVNGFRVRMTTQTVAAGFFTGAFRHEVPRTTITEATNDPLGQLPRWIKLANFRFLDLSILFEHQSQGAYQPSGKTWTTNRFDTLALSQTTGYYLRQFVVKIVTKVMQNA